MSELKQNGKFFMEDSAFTTEIKTKVKNSTTPDSIFELFEEMGKSAAGFNCGAVMVLCFVEGDNLFVAKLGDCDVALLVPGSDNGTHRLKYADDYSKAEDLLKFKEFQSLEIKDGKKIIKSGNPDLMIENINSIGDHEVLGDCKTAIYPTLNKYKLAENDVVFICTDGVGRNIGNLDDGELENENIFEVVEVNENDNSAKLLYKHKPGGPKRMFGVIDGHSIGNSAIGNPTDDDIKYNEEYNRLKERIRNCLSKFAGTDVKFIGEPELKKMAETEPEKETLRGDVVTLGAGAYELVIVIFLIIILVLLIILNLSFVNETFQMVRAHDKLVGD